MSNDRKDDSLGASDFELVEKMGNDLLSLMAQGIPEQEFRVLLTSALAVISNMRSFATVQALLNPENIVPKSGTLTQEQVRNFFKHLSSLSISLSATQKPLRQNTGPQIGPNDVTVRIPLQRSDAEYAEQFFSQAKLEYQRNNFFRAKELIEAAIAKNPKSSKYQFVRGLCCSHLQRFHKQAEDSFLSAIKMEPYRPEYRITLINFYRKNGLLIRAIKECEQAAQAVPEDKRIQHLLRELKTKGLG